MLLVSTGKRDGERKKSGPEWLDEVIADWPVWDRPLPDSVERELRHAWRFT